jgi:hypothetical protein
MTIFAAFHWLVTGLSAFMGAFFFHERLAFTAS